jgi:putative transposase
MNMQAFTRTNNCVFALTYHMVLVTKRRRPVLTGGMIDQARGIATERCAAHDGHLIELNGEADHLHMLVSLPPTTALAEFANALKTSTSRLLRRDHPGLRPLVPELLRQLLRRGKPRNGQGVCPGAVTPGLSGQPCGLPHQYSGLEGACVRSFWSPQRR